MSIHQLLEMSRRSFRALDAAMNTVGQNVANAETPGYTRRRLVLQADSLSGTGVHSQLPRGSSAGLGVSVQAYERLRDPLLLRAGWEAGAGLGFSEEEHRVTAALEGLFPIDSDGALGPVLNEFWNAWSDLADHPTDNGVRLSLRSRAGALAATLNRLDQDVRQLQTETQDALAGGVDEVNALLSDIAALNDTITRAHHSGSPNLEAADQRDVLIGRLAEYVPVQIQEGQAGSVSISVDGMALVQHDRVTRLTVDATGETPQVRFEGTDVTFRTDAEGNGRLGGWLHLLNHTLPETRTALDDLAGTLVREVNALHTGGFGLDGSTDVAFFHEEGVTAATIRLSSEVLADSKSIATSSQDPASGVNDGTVALDIARLRDALLMNDDTESTETFVINLVSDLGARVDRASSQYESRAAFASHVEAMEKGISGVSLEEEMTKLIQYQQSFQAATRVLNTAQEMMDALLAL